MCTACHCLADNHSPYVSTGLGNYYTTTPEHWAFLFFGKKVVNTIFLDIWKKLLGNGSVDFRLQNTKLLPVSLPAYGLSGQRSVTRHLPFLLAVAAYRVDTLYLLAAYSFPCWCLHLNPPVLRWAYLSFFLSGRPWKPDTVR